MKKTSSVDLKRLNRLVAKIAKNFKPPEGIPVSDWADQKRYLSSEGAATPGPWRTSRVPYLKDPMDAFSDPMVQRIVMVAASQVGKSEMLLNCIGYVIDEDPGSILFIQPNLDDARKFSRLRVSSMIRDTKALKEKVAESKSRDSSNTILQKAFPGGMLTITGSNTASALSSIPARYVFGDERDRWASDAGGEGDPWALAEARQTTFYNRKSVEVSTPTVKGASNIADSYALGTQERWCHKCPACEEYHEITFSAIRFKHITKKIRGKKDFTLDGPVEWICPTCGCLSSEEVMRRQPAKWIAENPDAIKKGIKSFWLNAFASPWVGWDKIVIEFLEAQDDPKKLQVVFNTKLGELWEERGDMESEETMLARREDYGTMKDGRTPADLPDGVLLLTCGVDNQDDRLEYEVVGHGRFGETWGIEKGFIPGRPDLPEVWAGLDAIIDRTYYFQNGNGLKISVTFVDSGGHYTQFVYAACRERFHKKVFAIKGSNIHSAPYVKPPSKVPIRQNKRVTCWLYNIGVDAGKADIMNNLRVQEPGPKYCHFPIGNRGYDHEYFNGLLSERMVHEWTSRGKVWKWVRIQGHAHNEALDCRNYAMAARQIMTVDLDGIERQLKGMKSKKMEAAIKKPPRSTSGGITMDDW